MQQGRHIAHKFESGWEVGVIKAFSSRLKDPEIKEQFKRRVESLSQAREQEMESLILKLTGKPVSTEDFADAANYNIVTILHTAGEEILGLASFEPNHPRKTSEGYHASSVPQEADSQMRIQTLKNQLRKDTELNKPQSILDDIASQLKREKSKLDEMLTQKRNHKFLHAMGAAQPKDQDPKTPSRSMWDYLKRYKTDHVQSTLPKAANDNASTDPRIGKLGPLSLDPLIWHRYRFALSHPLQGHKESP
jgi:hypothetical protein